MLVFRSPPLFLRRSIISLIIHTRRPPRVRGLIVLSAVRNPIGARWHVVDAHRPHVCPIVRAHVHADMRKCGLLIQIYAGSVGADAAAATRHAGILYPFGGAYTLHDATHATPAGSPRSLDQHTHTHTCTLHTLHTLTHSLTRALAHALAERSRASKNVHARTQVCTKFKLSLSLMLSLRRQCARSCVVFGRARSRPSRRRSRGRCGRRGRGRDDDNGDDDGGVRARELRTHSNPRSRVSGCLSCPGTVLNVQWSTDSLAQLGHFTARNPDLGEKSRQFRTPEVLLFLLSCLAAGMHSERH